MKYKSQSAATCK